MKQTTLKMNCIGNTLIMIEVRLWSKLDNMFRKMYLTVDTGASVTTISKDLIYRLGYSFNDKNKSMITTASGVEYVDELSIDKIQIGSFVLDDVKIYAHTFPEESFSLGVLGLNILEKFDVDFKFSKKEIIFKDVFTEEFDRELVFEIDKINQDFDKIKAEKENGVKEMITDNIPLEKIKLYLQVTDEEIEEIKKQMVSK